MDENKDIIAKEILRKIIENSSNTFLWSLLYIFHNKISFDKVLEAYLGEEIDFENFKLAFELNVPYSETYDIRDVYAKYLKSRNELLKAKVIDYSGVKNLQSSAELLYRIYNRHIVSFEFDAIISNVVKEYTHRLN